MSKVIELEKQDDGTYSESIEPTRRSNSQSRKQSNEKSIRRNVPERIVSQRISSDPLQTLLNAAVRQLEREAKKLIRNIFR